MWRRKFRRLYSLVLLWLASLIFFGMREDVKDRDLFAYGIICAVAVFAISKIHQFVIPQFKRAPILLASAVAALIYMGAIVLSGLAGIVLAGLLASASRAEIGEHLVGYFAQGWKTTIGYPFLFAAAISILLELFRRIGLERIDSLLLGRYRNPREETRLILLIDLKGSTPLAERLGSVKYSYFLRDFFDDLTEPVLQTEGEIVEYVGDEAVISWPFRSGANARRAIRCFAQFKRRIEQRSSYYQATYEVVPCFKGAVHAGPVVATEVGQLKTQVVLHGDTMNTVSRVLGKCNALGAELLITDVVARHTIDKGTEELGAFELRGKGEAIALYSVTPRAFEFKWTAEGPVELR